MVQTPKSSSSSRTKEGNWGMGFLLVFFHHNPDEDPPPPPPRPPPSPSPPYTRRSAFSLSSRKNSNNALISKTQSTLSICALFVFSTLLFFTVSSFEPSSTLHHHHHRGSYNRRILHQIPQTTLPSFSVSRFIKSDLKGSVGNLNFTPALQGMGVLYRRGSKSMTDFVVGHVAEGAKEREIVTFLRLVHHSGLLSRADLLLIFDSPSSASRLGSVVRSESESFLKLLSVLGSDSGSGRVSVPGLARYLRPVGEEDKEPLWGKKGNFSNSGESTRASYGSVVGFYASELDPEDSLSGFLAHVPMGLRRWACYPMLLGRVRRNFKHTMLVDVRNSLVLSDPFSPVRNRSTESVFIYPESETELTRSHGRRNSGESRLNSGVILGGARGVRRFANAALTEIVRVAIEHKGKAKGRNSVTESGLVNQLVHNGHLLKSINLITPSESIPDASSLTGFNSLDSTRSKLLAFGEYFPMVQRGHSGGGSGNVIIDIDDVIKKEICLSHGLYSSVYRDCLASQ